MSGCCGVVRSGVLNVRLGSSRQAAADRIKATGEDAAGGHTTGDLPCTICGEIVDLARVRRLQVALAEKREENAHVLEFARCSAFGLLMQGGVHHRALTSKQLRKEVTETWAIVKAAEVVMARAGVAGDDVAFLDLCCGKSLNSTLLTLLYPNAKVVAIDLINPASVRPRPPPLATITCTGLPLHATVTLNLVNDMAI